LVELKPLPVVRVCHALAWPLLGVAALIALVENEVAVAVLVVAAVVCLAAGAYLGFRGWRLGVVCDDSGIEVRGLVRDRRISREQIVAVTNFPAVRWTTPVGKARWTPIFAFANPVKLVPFVERHNEAATAILQDWQTGTKPRPPKKRRTRQR
jgi:hypothetical protein